MFKTKRGLEKSDDDYENSAVITLNAQYSFKLYGFTCIVIEL